MNENKFEIAEFKESYTHYRHLEQERSRHIAFFFTLFGGLFAVLGILAKEGRFFTPVDSLFLVACIIVMFLQVLDIVIMAAIRRIGDARAQHAKIIVHLRNKLSSDNHVADLWASFEKRPHLSVQIGAEWILHSFAFVFLLTNCAAANYAWISTATPRWQGNIVFGLTILLFFLHVVTAVILRPRDKQ